MVNQRAIMARPCSIIPGLYWTCFCYRRHEAAVLLAELLLLERIQRPETCMEYHILGTLYTRCKLGHGFRILNWFHVQYLPKDW